MTSSTATQTTTTTTTIGNDELPSMLDLEPHEGPKKILRVPSSSCIRHPPLETVTFDVDISQSLSCLNRG
eukprot:CAMPEP_0168533402 /NCGR_PEP_ID=MMETSP0405-20121227/17053_1 /TAXON_ID=498012 /ORGANISM="Trichosphaerium sp, Strain Am-I-7 wt" /LENGTH=69 /DNA_ID=CAMNT_0008559451 /DNA_START=9 /DNA_END=214 /DNA_ORIENTATION=+